MVCRHSRNLSCAFHICKYDINLHVSYLVLFPTKALGIARIMVRITIAISLVFISNIIVCIVLSIFTHINDGNNALLMSLVALCYVMDLKVNNVCLLYQYGFAQQLYDRRCRICNKCLKHLIFCCLETKTSIMGTSWYLLISHVTVAFNNSVLAPNLIFNSIDVLNIGSITVAPAFHDQCVLKWRATQFITFSTKLTLYWVYMSWSN